MMITSRVVSVLCALAPLILSCESAYQRLRSIEDLKEIDFGPSVPKHSLLLLHWFANAIEIDQLNTLTLTFSPERKDFGCHNYGNYENMLSPLPQGHRYFTVGNLNEGRSHQLPEYVRHPSVREYEGNNRDRIIFSVQETDLGERRISRVYLTHHYRPGQILGMRYNPDHTYRVSINLLRQIRMFTIPNNYMSLLALRDFFQSTADDSHLRDIQNTWGEELACLGLLFFIVIQEKQSINGQPRKKSDLNKPRVEETASSLSTVRSRKQQSEPRSPYFTIHPYFPPPFHGDPEEVSHELSEDVPLVRPQSSPKVQSRQRKVTRRRPKQMPESHQLLVLDSQDSSLEGAVDVKKLTGWFLLRFLICFLFCQSIIVQPENTVRGYAPPGRVTIAGYSPHLELVEKQYKAGGRLYVQENIRQWRNKFEQPRIGFYKSADKGTNEYEREHGQCLTKVQPCPASVDDIGFCFEHCSFMRAAAGVQTRFIIRECRKRASAPDLCSPNGVKNMLGCKPHLEFFEADSKYATTNPSVSKPNSVMKSHSSVD